VPTHAPALPHAGLSWPDYAAVAGYMLLTLAIVAWTSRRQKSTEDFFLGGRRMPSIAVGLSIMATLLSTITYLGLPGEVVKNGIAIFAGYLAYPFAMAFILLLLVPFFMRLRMTSAYEYLERRFDYRARLLGGLLFLLLRLGWISVVVYTASLALVEMTRSPLEALLAETSLTAGREPLYFVIVAVGLASTVYACAGGMRAVIWTDVLQSFMLFGGAGLIVGYVIWTTGAGPSQWWDRASQFSSGHTSPPWFSFDPTVRMTVFTSILMTFTWNICTHGSDQVVLQRYFATDSLASASKSYIVSVVSQIGIGFLLALSGLALLYFYLEHPHHLPEGISPLESADKVMPHFYAHQLPVGLGGLILASFLCDAMQTLVSGVNSITAVAAKDVFDRWAAALGGRGELAVARLLTLGVGLVVTCMACGVAMMAMESKLNIIDLNQRSFNMFLGPLAALFFIGMFLPRCTSRSAVPAALLGVGVALTWSYWRELCLAASHVLPAPAAEVVQGWSQHVPSMALAVTVPCLASMLIAAVLGLLVDSREHAGRDYSWRAVMRRPRETATTASPD
jgi:SSS family solute:Na+ symporter